MTTLSLIVENSAGVLTRVSGLISRRGFNIDSLAVGTTENPDLSRITIVVSCDEATVTQMVDQISKLYCVQSITVLEKGSAKSRELMLVRVKAENRDDRNDIINICNAFSATPIETTADSIMIEFAGDLEKEASFMSLIGQYDIIELARTGVIALEKAKQI